MISVGSPAVLAYDTVSHCHRVVPGWQIAVMDRYGNIRHDAYEVYPEEEKVLIRDTSVPDDPWAPPVLRVVRVPGLRVIVDLTVSRNKAERYE